LVAGIKELLQAYEGTPAELSSETGQAPTPTVTPEGLVQTVKDFSPASDMENIVEAGKSFSEGKYGEGLLKTAEGGLPLLLGAIGTALGSPAGGAAAYTGTKAAIKGGKQLINKFTTSRGSTYDHFDSGTTIRNRSPKDHPDKTEGLQPESGKTIFVDYEGVNTIGPILQNTEMATQLLPIVDKNNKLLGTKVVLLEDSGPMKAGETLVAVKATTTPEKGLYPVEMWRSESPKGDPARGIHFGNKIIDVTPVKPVQKSNADNIPTKKKGGSIVERNTYSNYKPRAI